MNMIECGISNLSKSYGATKIFENVTFDIKTGERLGLIGGNGTGKTTIMKILMGKEDYEGNVFFRKGAKLGYLDQIPVFEEDYTVKEVLYLAFEAVFNIKKQLTALEERLSDPAENMEQLMKEYGILQERFELLGGYETEEKFSKVVIGLNITEAMLAMKFDKLSGGEKSKIMLGKILLEKPDILLLDEPSNHLDLKAIEWLESYLKDYKGAVLIISHDRYFLDRVVDRIVELDYYGVITYHGNYSYYLVEKERRFMEAMQHYKENQKKIKRMEEQIKRFRIWGQMRDSDKMYKRAKELEKRLEKMEKLDKPVLEKTKIKLSQKAINRTGKEVLTLRDVKKGFDTKLLFNELNLTLFYQDSLAILGDNGTGKSTLLKIIMEELEPDAGKVKYGAKLNIGYLPQEIQFEDESLSILEAFQYQYNLTIGDARKELAKVMFIKDDVFKKINMLSGGEKSRLKLCMLMFEKTNFMILDEPTNHLDIDSREVLEETLLNFQGTILFVSHDRYFINKIATKIGEIDSHHLTLYQGDYEYYKQELEKKALEDNNAKPKVATVKRNHHEKDDKKRRIQSNEKKLLSIETSIESVEASIASITDKMVSNSSNADELLTLEKEKKGYLKMLDAHMQEWEQISEILEKLESRHIK
ncbi:ABC-F type ribosomal protection protein [Vallitalea pronyensis]|uniref:ABC-F type ribosomal protection protein n=1 Tax=Vallitalea pronyensis TaxID=1348613 RepID=A0A8J8MLL7_9FIRM|nr:ABC-F type ribosomal protection protein [Vallitalea pronyensis]QUI23553.1 ABC-F type ribosomal protection protein [Vallitalea pronyensis]